MKKLLTILTFVLFSFTTFSQVDGISYQAVIIDNNADEIPGVDVSANNLPNTSVEVKFTITGNSGIEYQETHSTSTDDFGMLNLMIGQGQITGASPSSFNQIYWDGNKGLQVEIDLNNGDGFIVFSNQELTYIPYVKHREIVATSTLDVDGETNLNSNLTVNNQSPTLLTGDLTVEGLVAFDGGLDVGGDAQFYSDLTVEGATNLNGGLDVLGNSNFQDGVFENLTVNQTTDLLGTLDVVGVSNFDGQVTIDANVNGADNLRASYPLRVQGSNQGIHVRVDGIANNANNYITFSDGGGIKGGIEGQSYNDLVNSFEYTWNLHLFFIDLAFITGEGLACAVQLDLGEVALMAANDIAYGIHYQNQEDYFVANYGVYFKSGGADYAEYLEKETPTEIFRKGDIVGVIGGKISKNTKQVDHVMVISSYPIVLGNLPGDSEKFKYEKVAFLGQVPVRVVGKVEVGDYILPSQNNDGLGIAISPKNMNVNDFKNILGVAWEKSYNDIMSTINVAVGINSNDIALKVDEQQKEIEKIKNQLENIIARLDGEPIKDIVDNKISNNQKDNNIKNIKKSILTKEDFDKWIEEYGYVFEYYMDELKKVYAEKGINYKQYKDIAAFVDNPKKVLKDMYNGNYMPTLWQSFEKKYPKAFINQE